MFSLLEVVSQRISQTLVRICAWICMFSTPEGYLWVVRARIGAAAGRERAQLGDKNRWGKRICYWRNRWLWNERLYLIFRFNLLSVQPLWDTQDCVGRTLGVFQEFAQSEMWGDGGSTWTSSSEAAEKSPRPFRNDHRIAVLWYIHIWYTYIWKLQKTTKKERIIYNFYPKMIIIGT